MLVLALFRAPVAQLDRASDYGSEGLGFDSLWVRHFQWGVGTAGPKAGAAHWAPAPAYLRSCVIGEIHNGRLTILPLQGDGDGI